MSDSDHRTEQVAGDLTAGAVVGRLGARDVELVDVRRHRGRILDVSLEGNVDPTLRGDVEPGGRGVDGLAAGHDGVGVDRVDAAREIDGEHGERAEAGELAVPYLAAAYELLGLGLRARPVVFTRYVGTQLRSCDRRISALFAASAAAMSSAASVSG